MFKHKTRIWLAFILSFFCAFLGTTPTFASVDSVKDSPKSLYELEDYNRAMQQCMTQLKSFRFNQGQTCAGDDCADMGGDIAGGFSKQTFFEQGPLVYNNLLESKHGSYSDWFNDYSNNGDMYCSEKDSDIFDGATLAKKSKASFALAKALAFIPSRDLMRKLVRRNPQIVVTITRS